MALVVVSTSTAGGGLNPVNVTMRAGGTPGGTPGVTRLDQLVDVVESAPANGMTLVYNSENDKYVVQTINLDGGEF